MKKIKEVKLNLEYIPSKIINEKKMYIGGVEEPKYLNELNLYIGNDYTFDMENEEFIENGKFAVELSGSKRALIEFGKYLINIGMFETEDEGYHEHLDDLLNENGEPIANLTVRPDK